LANTVGGVIVYGVETERDAAGNDTGVAKSVVGLPGINADKEKQRLAQMLHDGITPSLASHVAIQDIPAGSNGAAVIALGVTQSLARPHMISFQHSGKIWRRSDSGKYQPDIEELRSMFREAESWSEAADAFRNARLKRVRTGRFYPSVENSAPAAFVHVLPLGRLSQLIDLAGPEAALRTSIRPLGRADHSTGFNADGFWLYYRSPDGTIQNYSLFFRFGGVEGYDSTIVQADDPSQSSPLKRLFAQELHRDTTRFVADAVKAMTSVLDIPAPYVVMLSILGISGTRLLLNPDRSGQTSDPIYANDLILPPVIIEEERENYTDILRPVFDVIWQAAERPRMPEVRDVGGNS
jgi:hypothetical protein